MADTRKPAKKTTRTTSSAFTEEERAAMKERAKEVKRGARASKEDGEAEVLAKIAELPEADRVMAERVHAVVMATVPGLTPRTWYGMPAYAKDGNVIVFFQDAHKFKARYATLGFSDKAKLDDGDMWPTSYAVKELTPEVEAMIRELVKRAAG
jgi:uncharacterized protein YdhG (YjbR/CyaY superfamily)